MSRGRIVIPGCIGVAAAVALAVAGVDWIDTGTARQPAMAVPQVRLRAPAIGTEETIQRLRVGRSIGHDLAPHANTPSLVPTTGTLQAEMQTVSSLAAAAGADAASALAQAALSHAAPAIREEAVYALGERDGPIAVQTLQQALRDPSPRVRQAACRVLAAIGADGAVLALSSVLGSEDASLRADAVDALAEIGGPAAMHYLEQMVGDENEVVREAAGEWLAELAADAPAPRP